MSQSRSMSIAEVGANYGVGLILSMLITYYVLPIWGFEQSVSAAVLATAIFTLASLARMYVIRRAFNWIGG